MKPWVRVDWGKGAGGASVTIGSSSKSDLPSCISKKGTERGEPYFKNGGADGYNKPKVKRPASGKACAAAQEVPPLSYSLSLSRAGSPHQNWLSPLAVRHEADKDSKRFTLKLGAKITTSYENLN